MMMMMMMMMMMGMMAMMVMINKNGYDNDDDDNDKYNHYNNDDDDDDDNDDIGKHGHPPMQLHDNQLGGMMFVHDSYNARCFCFQIRESNFIADKLF